MSWRRRRDGDPLLDDDAQPRVRGAWTTPAVVVRGPDGSVIDPRAARPRPAAPETGRDQPDDDRDDTGETTTGGTATRAGRPARPRPRRIPGAIGAALIEPRLLVEAADGKAERRARRQAGPDATVTRLPLRRSRRRAENRPGAEVEVETASPTPGLRSVAGRADAKRTARRTVSGRGARGPAPSHPGERRRERMLRAVANIDLSRLAGPDEETRERRRARLRWVGARLGVFVLVAVLLYSIFPVRTYLAQRASISRGHRQVEVIDSVNGELEKRLAHDRKDSTTEELARQLGLVKPGEESYGILPAPQQAPSTTTTTTTPPTTP